MTFTALLKVVHINSISEYSLGYGTLQGTLQTKRPEVDDVNIYRPSVSTADEEIYKERNNTQNMPPGAYPGTEHSRFDGRYIYDHEAPPRPPLPPDVESGMCFIYRKSGFYLRIILQEFSLTKMKLLCNEV